jgi:hypothetical protein
MPYTAIRPVLWRKTRRAIPHVRDALRRAGKPIRLNEVVEAVTADLGHDRSAIPALRHRIRASLAHLEKSGKVAKAGRGMRVTWALAV